MVATITALGYTRLRPTMPPYVMLIMPVFVPSPGSHGLKAMEYWLAGNEITGVNNLTSLAGILLAIAIRLLAGVTVMKAATRTPRQKGSACGRGDDDRKERLSEP